MPKYLYSVRDQEGRRISGKLEAPDRGSAFDQLSRSYPLVTRLDEVREGGFWQRLSQIRRPRLLALTQQLAAVTKAGLTLKAGLDLVVEDCPNLRLRQVLLDVSSRLQSGQTLSYALQKHPTVFSNFYSSLVEAGELTGSLPIVFQRLADHIESEDRLLNRVKSAFYYPCVVLLVACLMSLAMITFGLPRFEEIYLTLGVQLPGPTQALLQLGKSLHGVWVQALVAAALFAWGLRRLLLGPWRAWFDGQRLSLPGLGELYSQLAMAHLARTLSMLYSCGVDLIAALELTARSSQNLVVRRAILQAVQQIQAGKSLSDALRQQPVMATLAVGMIAAGEATGSLDELLSQVGRFYEGRVEFALTALTSTIEPLLMLLVGILLGGLIITMGLPFLNLASVL